MRVMTDPQETFGGASALASSFVQTLPDRASAPSPFRVDEGYSEDPRSQADSDTDRDADMKDDGLDNPTQSPGRVSSARQWLLSQPIEIRAALARDLIHSLPTSIIADLVREANHRLHFDPVECLPHEIITSVFEYLDPKALVSAALTCKSWKLKAYDSRLWRHLFALEGWSCDRDKLDILEMAAKRQKRPASAVVADNPADPAISQAAFSKRHRTSRQAERLDMPHLQSTELNPSDEPDLFADIGIPAASLPTQVMSPPLDHEMEDAPDGPVPADRSSSASHSKFFTWDATFEQPIVNWQYIYSQRRRLERNWFTANFNNFRLPHPDHADEAHTQCVYTIQFSDDHLVSGSRDKTVRVWDLRTQRLRLPPLEGHTGSVLCLQFDERRDQDIIVSGGSDADVIIWRFSDGAMLKRMASAHTESVLNLRFDERYLVTCSKDKTIRVWNRASLCPADPDYPDKSNARNARYPEHIVNVQDVLSGMSPSLNAPLEPYSLLMTFDGHGAAVNALQVHEHEIVSASGDRKVMLWNIKTGDMTRVFSGHTKGIACIQYDGRRIVSGSSDNTVRIFDASTSAEVATLDGHRNLVRTVQAEFGDLSTSVETLEAEARRHSRRIIEGRLRRAQASAASGDDTAGDAMSVVDDDLESDHNSRRFVLGNKLPPGGGGTRWSKIVSGSYDETLIIWRRDKIGRWYIAKELRQEDALRNASRSAWRQSSRRRRLSQDAIPAGGLQQPQEGLANAAGAAVGALSAEQAARAHAWHLQNFLFQQRQARLAAGGAVATAAAMAAGADQSSPSNSGASATTTPPPTTASGPPAGVALPDPEGHATQLPAAPQAPASGASQPPGSSPLPHHHHVHRPLPPGTNFAAQNPLHRRPHHHHHHHHNMAAATAAAGGPSLNNRVFKLQFDSRRIVCCSQEPVIVGWDFAAGEQDLINSSWIFGTPR